MQACVRNTAPLSAGGALGGPYLIRLSLVRTRLQHPPYYPLRTATDMFSAEALAQQGIFGVPLIQSIPYANVAISLFNEHGESYIYGYVPIVVAKCGVFLKEKGQTRSSALTTNANCSQRLM